MEPTIRDTDSQAWELPPLPALDRPRLPLVLLADSSPLFRSHRGQPFMARLRALVPATAPRAAYLGVSNGDDPAAYGIFEAAMDAAGIDARRMIPSDPSDDDRAWLASAHVILLAGGNVRRGWQTLQANGSSDVLARRHRDGALLIGVSAGAMHLGLGAWYDDGFQSMLGIVRHVVAAHDEERSWVDLRRCLRHLHDRGRTAQGIGLPWGSALLHHTDGSQEAWGRAVVTLRATAKGWEEGRILVHHGSTPTPTPN